MQQPHEELRRLERALAAAVLAPDDRPEQGVFAVPAGALLSDRLAVYAGGYPARIESALAEAYPALRHLIGPSRWSSLVSRFAAAAPPIAYNLNACGADLPGFLAGDAAAAALVDAMPFLVDLAALEWAIAHAFHARVESSFDTASAAGWSLDDWYGARLRLRGDVRVVRSAWPVHTLWSLRDTPLEDIDVDLVGRPESLLVHRSGIEVVCRAIDAGEAAVLDAVARGCSLGAALDDPAVAACSAATVAEWFSGWMQAGWIAGATRAAGVIAAGSTPVG